jgi:predicted HTH domain antitoxin
MRVALAAHLFLTKSVSLARAAELAGETRASFENLLLEAGLPTVFYDREEYERDQRTLENLRRRASG